MCISTSTPPDRRRALIVSAILIVALALVACDRPTPDEGVPGTDEAPPAEVTAQALSEEEEEEDLEGQIDEAAIEAFFSSPADVIIEIEMESGFYGQNRRRGFFDNQLFSLSPEEFERLMEDDEDRDEDVGEWVDADPLMERFVANLLSDFQNNHGLQAVIWPLGITPENVNFHIGVCYAERSDCRLHWQRARTRLAECRGADRCPELDEALASLSDAYDRGFDGAFSHFHPTDVVLPIVRECLADTECLRHLLLVVPPLGDDLRSQSEYLRSRERSMTIKMGPDHLELTHPRGASAFSYREVPDDFPAQASELVTHFMEVSAGEQEVAVP